MLRIGIGLGIIGVLGLCFFGWLKRHDAQTYARASFEITSALQADAAAKVRAGLAAEDAVTPTPDAPEALAKLCKADPDCRDRKGSK